MFSSVIIIEASSSSRWEQMLRPSVMQRDLNYRYPSCLYHWILGKPLEEKERKNLDKVYTSVLCHYSSIIGKLLSWAELSDMNIMKYS